MNNICIDHDTGLVTVEGTYGGTFALANPDRVSLEGVADLIRAVLNTARYGGESLCVEEKRNGMYSGAGEENRWSFRPGRWEGGPAW